MSRSVVVSYDLHPPSGVEINDLSTSKTHEFLVPPSNIDSFSQYYNALRQSIIQAKNTFGEELTAWRDAVGSKEASKEPKASKKDDEEEEEEEEETSE